MRNIVKYDDQTYWIEMTATCKRLVLTPILIIALVISYYLYLNIFEDVIRKLISIILLVPSLTLNLYCLVGIIRPDWVMTEPGKLK